MTKFDIIAKLKEPFYANKKVDALIKLNEQNRALACKCTPTYTNDGTQNGNSENSIENAIHKILDINIKIAEEIDRLADTREEVLKLISMLDNADLEAVLINRHLNYMTIEQTADVMHYSTRSVTEKQRKAIEKIAQNCVELRNQCVI